MELINDYDLAIEYHPGKANKVADALSRKTHTSAAQLAATYIPQLHQLQHLGVQLNYDPQGALIAAISIRPTLVEQIKA